MNILSSVDLRRVVNRLPVDVRHVVKAYNLYVSGGFIRAIIAGEPVSDIDICGPDKKSLSVAKSIYQRNRGGFALETENAFTVFHGPGTTPVQFIFRWTYPTPMELIQSFDFTVCQAAVYWNSGVQRWESRCGDSFYVDLAARRLVYTSPKRSEDAGGSILRMVKYVKRGYNVQAPSIAALVARIMAAIPPNERQASEETLVRKVLTLLREVDPLPNVDGLPAPEEEFTPDHE